MPDALGERSVSSVSRGWFAASAIPVDDTPTLIADRQRGGGIDALAARGGFDLARNLQVTSAAFATAERNHDRHVADGDSIIDAQLQRIHRRPCSRDFRLR